MLYPEILVYIEKLKQLVDVIPDERKRTLLKISDFVRGKKKKDEKAALIFICTHNSRRSHFGQIWGQALAAYFELNHVVAYSGGTEATAFHPNAIKAIKSVGFNVLQSPIQAHGDNIVYEVLYGVEPKILAFSKKYNDPSNPERDFCAIMTCSNADENCPIVLGAELRIAVPYDDPKAFDNTPQQDEKYAERCRQIASELFYMYSKI